MSHGLAGYALPRCRDTACLFPADRLSRHQAGRPTLCPRLRRVRDPPRDRRSGALIEAAALAAATTHEAAPVHACARVVCAALTG
jgi:hypothetical protein